MASLANKDEAEKCRDMAKRFLERGEREKAVRFFEKSLKLYPLPGVETMRDLAKVLYFCDTNRVHDYLLLWGIAKKGYTPMVLSQKKRFAAFLILHDIR